MEWLKSRALGWHHRRQEQEKSFSHGQDDMEEQMMLMYRYCCQEHSRVNDCLRMPAKLG